jgi:ferredoxin
MEIEKVKEHILEGRPGFTRQYGPARTDHQPGIPFFPQEVTRDLVVIFLLTAIMFFLSAVATPSLGPARTPSLPGLIVPDWYLLFSWGLLKLADIFPQFVLLQGTPLETQFNAAFWGDILSGLPPIFLLLLPFLDRGREARPAKAPFRSAFGIAFLIIWVFFASLYSVRELIWQYWKTPNGGALFDDTTLKLFFVVPSLLIGFTVYVALRRLGFQPMRRWVVPATMIAFLVVAGESLAILFVPGWLGAEVRPYWVPLAAFLFDLSLAAGATALAVLVLPESAARRVVHIVGVATFLAFVGLVLFMYYSDPTGFVWIESVLLPNSNTLLLFTGFGVMTAWFGLRRPYSTYEYLLNECYQCGKCHTVCPVTKVEDDALGGLNLVYNSFKKQHDGVPLWTCLACDACSAVCPLDIQYSDYILEERAKVHARAAADGGEVE